MIERLQIELQVDSDARSHSSSPYLEHEDFMKHCKANGVYTNAETLEAYEKKGLLYPCFRLLYPSELLRRRFKAILPDGNGQYRYRDEWEPLINLEEALQVSQIWHTKEFEKSLIKGHPLDQALASGIPFVENPSLQKCRAWSRYNIVEGTYEGIRSKKSRVIHYYSTWKLFCLDDLNNSNTVSYNRAIGHKSHLWLRQGELHACSLNEFMPYFRNVASFAYRHNLRQTKYFKNSQQTKAEWNEIIDKSQRLAKGFFKCTAYEKWVRFLRKLIELHETYRNHLRLIMAEEAKQYIVRTVRLIRFATDYDFKRICDDVCGPLINSFDGVGRENGVYIYPRKLEEILADEEWDLRKNVKRRFELDLKDFNKSLIEEEKISESLCEELFNALINEPEGSALAAIRKINKALNIAKLYRYTDMWAGVNELVTCVEDYGRVWHGGKYMEDILNNVFSPTAIKYSTWRIQLTGKDNKCTAANSDEFLSKLTFLLSAKNIPSDRRYGRHLLVAHLTRNFASHHKGLTGKVLRENLGNIYSALIRTLFVFYATYKQK